MVLSATRKSSLPADLLPPTCCAHFCRDAGSRTLRAVLAPTEFLPRDILFKTSSRVSLSSSLRMASRQERMIPSTLTLRHRSRTITMPTAPRPSTCRLKRATPGIAPTRSRRTSGPSCSSSAVSKPGPSAGGPSAFGQLRQQSRRPFFIYFYSSS